MPQQDAPAPGRGAFDRPGPHLVIRDFLGAETVSRLLGYAAEHQAEFQPSRVSNQDDEGTVKPTDRISSRLEPVRELEPIVKARVGAVLDQVFETLGTPAFAPARWEIEMVAHGDGAFFGRHVDTMMGSPETEGSRPRSARVISAVYYFSRTPQKFTGGMLRMHSLLASGEAGSFVDIAPENDSVLFFPSWFPHQVLPVSCPGGDFLDSRFAINCWLYN